MYTSFHDVDLPFQILEKFRRQLSTGDSLDSNWFTSLLFTGSCIRETTLEGGRLCG